MAPVLVTPPPTPAPTEEPAEPATPPQKFVSTPAPTSADSEDGGGGMLTSSFLYIGVAAAIGLLAVGYIAYTQMQKGSAGKAPGASSANLEPPNLEAPDMPEFTDGDLSPGGHHEIDARLGDIFAGIDDETLQHAFEHSQDLRF